MNARGAIAVLDDDRAVLDSVAALLEAHGHPVFAFESGLEFLAALDGLSLACVVCDVRMPDQDGLEILRLLRTRRPDLPVILMTGHGDIAMAVQAMKDGAFDFIEKPVGADALLDSLAKATASGRRGLAEGADSASLRGRFDTLTARERDILQHLVIGHPNKVIAARLGISPRTVEIHRARVMQKMAANSLSHLVRMAIAADLAA